MAFNTYDGDIVAWANEQAQLLRAGLFSQLDIQHIAEEIEDVGKSEKRELASRMAYVARQPRRLNQPVRLKRSRVASMTS
jgi:hypothetical protein